MSDAGTTFAYQEGDLYCEGVRLSQVAAALGTPLYLYSWQAIRERFQALTQAFRSVEHLICFSVKSNSNLGLLWTLGREGVGADVVSGGELYRVRRAGIPPERIVFSGVGKTAEEIRYALSESVLSINVESLGELKLVDRLASELKRKARLAIRVNPNVAAGGHDYVQTGKEENKFGIPLDQAEEAFRRARASSSLEVEGVAVHIGSQITSLEPYRTALTRVRELVVSLKSLGIGVRTLDIGGGLGIVYRDEPAIQAEEFARAVLPLVGDLGCRLLLEPGRYLAGNAGVLLTRVLYVKETPRKTFVVVDAAMNDLIRPSLYRAYHAIQPARDSNEKASMVADVVGPVCETGDFLALGRELPRVEEGDLLAVMGAGAYGFSMASNYNSRPRPPEALVYQDRYAVIRVRESYEDLVRGERLPEELFAR